MPPVTFPDPFIRTSQPPLHVVAVIPARYDSTRFPGKPLADLDGTPMIEHVCRRAAAAPGVDAVVVATDDERIAAVVRRFGGVVRLTSPAHRTGTDRLAEVARDLEAAIVVNVQGDEPLIDPQTIAAVVEPLLEDRTLHMATACRPIDDAAEYANPNVVKVVRDLSSNALYFSRAPVPARSATTERPTPMYKHLGLYAYRREFLLTLAALPQTPLELAESLEQLRALEHGFRIRLVETVHDSIGVDTPEDLARARRQLQATRASEVA